MNKLFQFKISDIKFIYVISVLAIFSTLFLKLKFLDKTFIVSDDGWYITLLKDCPNFGVTRFHLLFKGIFGNDIYLIRMANYILMFLANLTLGYGIFSYLKKHTNYYKYNFILVLGFIFIAQQYLIACPSLNYITLNLIVTEFSLGCLFYAIASEKRFFLLLSGFFIGFLFPIMITNVVIIPFVILFMYFINKSPKDILYYISGILLFFVFYFTVIESPVQFIDFIKSETEKTINKGSSDYGILFLLKWIFNTLFYLAKMFLIAIICIFINKGWQKIRFRYKWWVVLSLLCLLVVWAFLYKINSYENGIIDYNNLLVSIMYMLHLKELFWITLFFSILR